VSIATLVGSDTDGAESRTAAYFGLSVIFHPEGSVFGFETGLGYVPEGASVRVNGGAASIEITDLEVPLLLRVAIPIEGSSVRPVLVGGGSVGSRIGCKIAAESGSASASIDCDDSAFQGVFQLKDYDLAWTLGADLELPIGSTFRLVPSLRYTRGLVDIGDTANNADAKTQVFKIGASGRFVLR